MVIAIQIAMNPNESLLFSGGTGHFWRGTQGQGPEEQVQVCCIEEGADGQRERGVPHHRTQGN